jgi:hypothetical protein
MAKLKRNTPASETPGNSLGKCANPAFESIGAHFHRST